MTRQRAGSLVAALASVGFIATAVLHSTGYGPVTRIAMQSPTEFHALVPALWLAFAFELVVVGFIPPTGILLGVGGLALVAAGVLPRGAGERAV